MKNVKYLPVKTYDVIKKNTALEDIVLKILRKQFSQSSFKMAACAVYGNLCAGPIAKYPSSCMIPVCPKFLVHVTN